MLIYKKMSLFDAPEDSIIVHGCNVKGVWGSGIAKEFKKYYPWAFESYKKECFKDGSKLAGAFALYTKFFEERENCAKHKVGCLFTSIGYGKFKSNKTDILKYTLSAVDSCLDFLANPKNVLEHDNQTEIYSNKFNSGLFDVPWEETEEILINVLKHYSDFKWIICDINGDKNE